MSLFLLLVQPSPPKIFDVHGDEIVEDAGPFLEGQELFLSCEVKGGEYSFSYRSHANVRDIK